MIENYNCTKSLLKQASKYIEHIKCLDECKKCADFVGLLDKFPYLANMFFAMGMNRCYRSKKGDGGYPHRAESECIGYADPYLGHLMEGNDVLEDLCAYDFFYNTNHRPWAISLFACGYYIENKILEGKHFDLNAMKKDGLFLSVFTKYYKEWSENYAPSPEDELKSDKELVKQLNQLKDVTERLSALVELDINYVPNILKEKLSIIEYIIEKNSIKQ